MFRRIHTTVSLVAKGITRRPRYNRLSLLLLENRAVPATITVTNTLDDTATGNGVSLREAIDSINDGADLNADVAAVGAYGTNDTILFGAMFDGPQTINMSGEFDLSNPMTITGPGSGKLTIHSTAAQSATSRVFNITANSSISGMTLTGGNVIDSLGTGGAGGGILLAADATLTDTVVSGNTSKFEGGGIDVSYAASAATLTLVKSSVDGNTSLSVGGGVYLAKHANLEMVDSTISNNTATSSGGGVYFFDYGNLSMTRSTISGNHSSFRGGGVYFYETTASIVDSTISGNSALAAGGIWGVSYYAALVQIENSTIAFNSASGAGGIDSKGIDLEIDSTIVSNNSATSAPEIFGNVTANFSLIGSSTGSTSGAIISGANNILETDPLLGSLAFNGGLTQTHALMPGSPAINAGSNTVPLSVDQRGNTRPDAGESKCDMGAYETNF